MSITDIPSDAAIAEMVQGLPRWDPPRFELPMAEAEPGPEAAPVDWTEPSTPEISTLVQGVPLDGWGASFELPA